MLQHRNQASSKCSEGHEIKETYDPFLKGTSDQAPLFKGTANPHNPEPAQLMKHDEGTPPMQMLAERTPLQQRVLT